MKKKILIIGSNSFSAGSLIKILLKKNYKIIGISRSKLNDNRFLPYRKTNKNYIFRRLDINKDIKKKIVLRILSIMPHRAWLEKAGLTLLIGTEQIHIA